MEVVGAVASIAGIIGVTIQALSLIDLLKDFCSEFSDQNAQDFLHDLTVSAGIITDVKLLCERFGELNLAPQADFRISALHIQVEDCTKDLETWLNLGKHMTEPRSKTLKQIRSLKSFAIFLDNVLKLSKTKVRDRLRWHQENIKTTLSILGRQFDLANSARLQDVGETVQKIRRKLSFEAKLLTESLDGLSSSGSSMLAHSRTTNERLIDVQSETSALFIEIRDIKTMLRDLSANSSASSTHKNSDELQSSMRPSTFDPSKTTRSRHGHEINPTQKKETIAKKKLETTGTSTQHSTASNTDQRYEPEFETLLRATKNFVNKIQQLYHPLIAEYIATANAWTFLQVQLRCLTMELPQGHWSNSKYMALAKKKTQKLNRATASQLLSLRKACFRESLTESLQEVDAKLNIDDTIITEWTEAIEQRIRGFSRLQLESIDLPEPLETKRDRLTRTNEWILGMYYASPSLINLHRSIYEDVISSLERKYAEAVRDRERAHEREKRNEVPIEHISRQYLQHRDLPDHAWERMMLKFWFLDSAADEWSHGPATATIESEATEVPFIADEVEEFLDGISEVFQPRQVLFKQPTYRSLKPQDISSELITGVEMSTPNISPDKVEKARLILEAYVSEPSASPLLSNRHYNTSVYKSDHVLPP